MIEIQVSLFSPSQNAYIYENKIVRAHGDYYLETPLIRTTKTRSKRYIRISSRVFSPQRFRTGRI